MWASRIPKNRSCITAINLRNLAWNKVKNNPQMSSNLLAYYIKYIEESNKYILRRSISKDDAFNLKKDWKQGERKEELKKKYKISSLFLHRVLNMSYEDIINFK